MKNSRFIHAVVVCLSVLALSSCSRGPVFSWAPILSDYYNPFGNKVFRNLCYAQSDTSIHPNEDVQCQSYFSIPDYPSNTFKVVPRDAKCADCLFFIGKHDDFVSSDADLARFDLHKKTIHVSEFRGLEWVKGDTFCIESYVQDFNSGSQQLVEITDARYGDKYYLPKTLCSRYFDPSIEYYLKNIYSRPSLNYEVLAYADGNPIAVTLSCDLGGQITLVSTPLMFSDYSLLFNNKEIVRLVMNITREAGCYVQEEGKEHLLQPIKFVSTAEYEDNDYYTDRYTYQSPFEFNDKIKGSASKFAKMAAKDIFTDFLYSLSKIILFFLIAVFSVFLLRRKQQIIPLFNGYRNRTAQYVRQVGLLYYNEGDFQTILKNKIVFFYAEVNERLHIQLSDVSLESQNASYLAAALSVDAMLEPFLHRANLALNKSLKVDEKVLEDMSRKMTVMSNILRGEQQQDVLMNMFLNNENNKV